MTEIKFRKTERIMFILVVCSLIFILLSVFCAAEVNGEAKGFGEMSAKERFNTGEMVKITAKFENPMNEPVLVKFECELYKDETLVDFFESEELRVSVGGTRTLSAYFKPDSTGYYTAKGHLMYAGRTTETKVLTFTVVDDEEEREKIVPLGSGVLAIAIVLVCLTLFFFYKGGAGSNQTKLSQFRSYTRNNKYGFN